MLYASTSARLGFYPLCIAQMTTTTINGTTYTFKKFEPIHNGKTTIFDLYKTPGETNRKAFEKWEKKLNRVYWLCGGSHSFSIYGNVIDNEGKPHAVKITKANAYILKD